MSISQPDITRAVLRSVHDFLGGPTSNGDEWCFEFGEHLHSNWGAVYGGALAAGALAVARSATPERSPRSMHIQMVRSVPSGRAFATATVRHSGRTVATVEVDVYDTRRKLAAIALLTMVTPEAVAAEYDRTTAAPPFRLIESPVIEDDLIAGGTTAGIVAALQMNARFRARDVMARVDNVRPSVDGTAASAVECTVPWADLEHTGPEAACLITDSIVALPVTVSYIPADGRRTESRSHLAVHHRARETRDRCRIQHALRPARNHDDRHRSASGRRPARTRPRNLTAAAPLIAAAAPNRISNRDINERLGGRPCSITRWRHQRTLAWPNAPSLAPARHTVHHWTGRFLRATTSIVRAVIGGQVTTALDAEAMLRTYSDRFTTTVGAMSARQWSYRAPSGGWSVSEVTEHVAIANQGVFRRLSRGLETPLRNPLGVTDDEIPYLFYLGDEPPNVATPTGTWTDADDGATTFRASAQALIDWAAESELDLRSYGASHPVFGLMDGVQWLLFASAHTERHRRQLLGFQGQSDYPTR